MTVAPLSLLEFGSVGVKSERLPRDLLVFSGHANLHESERSAGLRFRGSDAQQQRIALGQAPAHPTELAQQARQFPAPDRDLLLLPAFALGQHIHLAILAEQLHLDRVAYLLPG